MTDSDHTEASLNIRNLVAACSAISVFGLAFGMTYPLLSLILESRGVSTDMIGLNSAMMPIGILLFSPFIPFATRHLGARNVAIIAALLTVVIVLTYKAFDTLSAWFFIRLLQGMTMSTLFVLSEVWVVSSAGSRHRGKVVAIYGAILSASFGSGPLIVSWMGIHGWMPFIVGAIIIALGVIPLSMVREKEVSSHEPKGPGFLTFLPKAPMLLASVFAFAIFDAATLSLIPVYGIQYGFDVAIAANFLTALILGNTVLQLPIGWLIDRYPHRVVLGGCALIASSLLVLLPFVMKSFWLWPVLVFLGATGYGVYTVALSSLGERFQGAELVSGSSAFAVMWGLGALLGSITGGWSMVVFGSDGLPFHLAGFYVLLVAGLIFRKQLFGVRES
ncbi:MAG: MFS transporter [Gammaproteobacteria bacterium]|nr:MFS transporter [Gammaproteobacteria bacterium]NKB64920.1 MFS transporter [Gammaproteobacteria bacterium]